MSPTPTTAGAWSVVRNSVRTVFTLPAFFALHGWRSRHITRRHDDVDRLSEPAPPHSSHTDVQHRDDGVGPIVMRTYEITIADPTLSAEELIEGLAIDPNHYNSGLVSGFVRSGSPARNLETGDEFVVEVPGPWNGPVFVEAADRSEIVLATLQGHMEAGHVRFDTTRSDDGSGYSFRIRSWARAGDAGFAALHVGLPVGREAQAAMWSAMCDRAGRISGGERIGDVMVSTEQLNGSSRRR